MAETISLVYLIPLTLGIVFALFYLIIKEIRNSNKEEMTQKEHKTNKEVKG